MKVISEILESFWENWNDYYYVNRRVYLLKLPPCQTRITREEIRKEQKILQESIRVLKFSDTQEDWSVWEKNFLTRANGKEYRDVLKGKTPIPDDNKVIDESTDAGKL